MNVLVTGAAGFLGRHVVESLLVAGHGVRAVVRPGRAVARRDSREGVEVVYADLAGTTALDPALEGIGAVIHLAATMSGTDEARFSETVQAGERLFHAIDRSEVRRVLLCSSLAVYDWLTASGTVDESLPTKSEADARGYARAKIRLERIAMSRVANAGWQLTILRPGFVWGAGNEFPKAGIGPSLGPLQAVISPSRVLPLTHVMNCADAFRAALASPRSIGEIVNVVDPTAISAWSFAGEALRRSGKVRVPVPHALAWPAIRIAAVLARGILGRQARLPGILTPEQFAQRFRPLRYSTRKLRGLLSSEPPLSLAAAIQATWHAE